MPARLPRPPAADHQESVLELSSKILEHWPHLSGNAAKLIVWLVASGTKQGCVEAKNFEDIASANGWTLKVLRGAIKELEAKLHITVERATGRHALTRIQITPSLLGSGASTTPARQGSSAEVIPSPKGMGDTEAKITPSQMGMSEIPTPSLLGSSSVPDVPDEPQKSKLLELPEKYLAGELSAVASQTLEYIWFQCDRRFLSIGFVTIVEKYARRRPWPRPGVLASRVIDRCLYWQRKRRNEGKNPLLYAWPPGSRSTVIVCGEPSARLDDSNVKARAAA